MSSAKQLNQSTESPSMVPASSPSTGIAVLLLAVCGIFANIAYMWIVIKPKERRAKTDINIIAVIVAIVCHGVHLLVKSALIISGEDTTSVAASILGRFD